MSWNVGTILPSGIYVGNEADVATSKAAIRRADKVKILMFGAACESKSISSLEKFVPCDCEEVFSIGATDPDYDVQKYVNPSKAQYLFPGENILDKSLQFEYDKDVGTSGATALAAGLAAMIIFCTREGKQKVPENRKFQRTEECGSTNSSEAFWLILIGKGLFVSTKSSDLAKAKPSWEVYRILQMHLSMAPGGTNDGSHSWMEIGNKRV